MWEKFKALPETARRAIYVGAVVLVLAAVFFG